MDNTSQSARPWILQEREQYLGKYERYVKGYRPDAQNMVFKLLKKIPIRPAVHHVLDTAYKGILDNAPKDADKRDKSVEPLYYKIQGKIITYIEKKKEQSKDLVSLAETNSWAKEAAHAQENANMEKLLKASDHVEDTLFLAELAKSCELPSNVSHLGEELDELMRALSEQYFPLLSLSDRGKIKRSFNEFN